MGQHIVEHLDYILLIIKFILNFTALANANWRPYANANANANANDYANTNQNANANQNGNNINILL